MAYLSIGSSCNCLDFCVPVNLDPGIYSLSVRLQLLTTYTHTHALSRALKPPPPKTTHMSSLSCRTRFSCPESLRAESFFSLQYTNNTITPFHLDP